MPARCKSAARRESTDYLAYNDCGLAEEERDVLISAQVES